MHQLYSFTGKKQRIHKTWIKRNSANNIVHQIRTFNIFSFFPACFFLPLAALLYGLHLPSTPLHGVNEVLVYLSLPCFAFLSQKGILIWLDSILYLSVTKGVYTKNNTEKESQQSVCPCTRLLLNTFFFSLLSLLIFPPTSKYNTNYPALPGTESIFSFL